MSYRFDMKMPLGGPRTSGFHVRDILGMHDAKVADPAEPEQAPLSAGKSLEASIIL